MLNPRRSILHLGYRVALGAALIAGLAATILAALFGLTLATGHTCGRSPRGVAKLITRDALASVTSFVTDQGRCPSGEHEIVARRYMREQRRDPWGQPLFYSCWMTPDGEAAVSVRSSGKDRVLWTDDDLVADESSFVPSSSRRP